MHWRLLEADAVEAADGLATDETLCRLVGAGQSQPSLRLYTYRSHCALVGRFQDVAAEIDVAACANHGIPINRRPTGGGAILMGEDQLGIALAIPGRAREASPQTPARELMAQFAEGIIRGLEQLGVTATFRGKNDLEVDGRKLAGLGIHRDVTGGLLFHGSVLVDLDVSLMAQVLRTPFASIGPRELAIIARRTQTIRQQLDREIAVQEVRQAIAAGFATTFQQELIPEVLRDHELAAAEALASEKYATTTWLNQRGATPDHTGHAEVRTDAGTLSVRATLAGKQFKAVFILGDFFASEDAISDLEGRLRWHPVDRDAVDQTVREWSNTHAPDLPVDALVRTIAKAAVAVTTPYGCFVNPQRSELTRTTPHG